MVPNDTHIQGQLWLLFISTDLRASHRACLLRLGYCPKRCSKISIFVKILMQGVRIEKEENGLQMFYQC